MLPPGQVAAYNLEITWCFMHCPESGLSPISSREESLNTRLQKYKDTISYLFHPTVDCSLSHTYRKLHANDECSAANSV